MSEFKQKIGLGSVQFGIPYGISNTGGKTSMEEVERILDLAFKHQINVIDTASAYGTAEKVLGDFHKNRFHIISKFMPSQKFGSIKSQLDKSLFSLKVNNLYGYMAHRPTLLEEKDLKELEDLKEKNKINKIGVSLNSPEEFKRLKLLDFIPDIIQVPFNYFDNRFCDLMVELKSLGCEIHTRSTFLQGLFFINPDILPSFFNDLKEDIKILQTTCGNKLEIALLRFVLKQDFIDKVIIGVESEEQLQKNLKITTTEVNLKHTGKKYPQNVLMPVNWPKY